MVGRIPAAAGTSGPAWGNQRYGDEAALLLYCFLASTHGITGTCDGRYTGGPGGAGMLQMKMKFNFICKSHEALMRIPSFLLALFVATLFCPEVLGEERAPAIQDNSFLVEEAYNQEKSVVQHINTFSYYLNSHDWSYTFTQEWPVGGQRHQFSYTLAGVRPGAFSSQGAGVGDTLLNYRLQVIGSGDTRVAFAPRLSAILPSGNSDLGRGYGGAGVQTNLPLSVVLHPKLVSHWNAGTTYIPHARNIAAEQSSAWSYNAGQSLIWLAHPRFNVMFETYYLSAQTVVAQERTQWSRALFLNPGFRWAYNFSNGLQIVPGFAVPVGVGPSGGEKGLFFYLSFEHPFQKIGK